MTIGLSTYAFFWQLSDRVEKPLTLFDVLDRTADADVSLLQICDYQAIESMLPGELRDLRAAADQAGIELELGTRGLAPEHLRRYLDIAEILGATTLRSMVNSTPAEAEECIRLVLPRLVDQGVTLALETYEKVPTGVLVELVERIGHPRIGHPRIGICLDPANVVAALEHPRTVIDQTAAHVVNVHVKDFTFAREDGWVGFKLIGCPLGEGLLDHAHLVDVVDTRRINQVIEHWLPWQGSPDYTCLLEEQWTAHNLDYLRSKQS
ncbi:sugar phosphate isomerase/epimerase [Lentzea tibetensis]|uniref:Sugar phosphate isomerase/epimerase n=1 Tax=Lentzea tibetensis TaxID=2591470 RepID=A0A563F1I8_9PSEU|nr:TIM barrel protein [Lentzea tibetensis]TWP53611.1 sugar phosphate isomerase/epimerase [Lentzea tibetensis]